MNSVLLINAGSSSLKAAVYDFDATLLAKGNADWAGDQTRYCYQGVGRETKEFAVAWKGQPAAVGRFIEDWMHTASNEPSINSDIVAVGHRVVHGGDFRSAVQITPDVRSRIASLTVLAPLHNPPSLEALAAAEVLLPDVPHIAVFDTMFHASLPSDAYTYPIPAAWTQDWHIRKYGFHGLSHSYCSHRAAEMLGRPLNELRLVVCHLGHGCSVCAVQRGHSVETTMGFTPLDGLMMATRSGSIDPAIPLYVQRTQQLTAEAVERTLNRESGLLGVSKISGDMRQILSAAARGDQSAALALGIYVRRVRQAIGSYAVTMGGVDAIVFTAGVGEHADVVRARVCEGLQCLELDLDLQQNATCRPDADVAHQNSRGRILVISTNEELAMLREICRVIEPPP